MIFNYINVMPHMIREEITEGARLKLRADLNPRLNWLKGLGDDEGFFIFRGVERRKGVLFVITGGGRFIEANLLELAVGGEPIMEFVAD